MLIRLGARILTEGEGTYTYGVGKARNNSVRRYQCKFMISKICICMLILYICVNMQICVRMYMCIHKHIFPSSVH